MRRLHCHVLLASAVLVSWIALPATALGGPDAKLNAAIYKAKLVQAMDECAAPVTTVLGVSACDPANVNTDGTAFNIGKLVVKAKNKDTQVIALVKSSRAVDKAALASRNLQARLVVRVTRTAGSPLVTWEDFELECPASVATTKGNWVSKNSLQSCGLSSTIGREDSNREIVSAAIVDADTGLAIAVPGVKKKN